MASRGTRREPRPARPRGRARTRTIRPRIRAPESRATAAPPVPTPQQLPPARLPPRFQCHAGMPRPPHRAAAVRGARRPRRRRAAPAHGTAARRRLRDDSTRADSEGWPQYHCITVKPFGARLRTLSGRVVLALAVCVVVVGAGVVVVNRYIDDQVDKIPRVAVSTSPVGAHGMNFLIIGSDSRSFVNNETDYKAFSDKDTQNAPPRSDTLMVLHADGDNSFAVSFPRDLWVDIPGKGGAKINAAFNDGPQKVIDTVQSDFNVPINHYLEVDFVSFEGIVNAIG